MRHKGHVIKFITRPVTTTEVAELKMNYSQIVGESKIMVGFQFTM